ncbi:MAG: hypothetical protein II863_06865 [Kiritimatiellae bacterium]|nr:hypothetical protein [Kiritimatiellia bacterium]
MSDFGIKPKQGEKMNVSAVYVDANGLEYPIRVGGYKCSNAEEMMVQLDLKGLSPDDTIKVRVVNNKAELDKGDPIRDVDDITYAHFDDNGHVVLSGYGG